LQPFPRKAQNPGTRKRLGANDEQCGEEKAEPEIKDRVTHVQAPTVTP
jgi:hypothetical protein